MKSLRELAFRVACALAYDVVVPILAGVVVWILRETTIGRRPPTTARSTLS